MTISYNSNVPKEFQEELNENLRNIESEVGSFSMLAQSYEESFETQRLCVTTLNNLVEQQQKELEELKQDSQTHYDAFGHNHVRLTAIEESSRVTVHEVQQLKEESQAHFDALVQQKVAIDDLQSQVISLTANLLETVKSVTLFVKANDMRFQSIEEKLTYDQESQAHFDAFAIHRAAIADLQTQIDAFAIQLNHLQFLSKLLK